MEKATQGQSTQALGPRGAPTAHEMVKNILHQGILTGILPGGMQLVQSRIAAELAVSTRPVHDALRDLAAEGFVRFDSRGRAVVHEVNRTELVDIYEIRAMLEPLAAARAAKHASRADMLEAAGLLAAMERETDMSQWAEYNCEFHNAIERAGNGSRLAALLKNLRELSAIYVEHSLLSEPERVRCGNAEHAGILQAIVARDPSAAAEAMLQHLDGTLHVLLNVRRIGNNHRRRRSTG